MGTDIHAHFEIKVDGEWVHYSKPIIRRNYDLFEKMAGVRGTIEKAIAPPRGLPIDICKTVFLDYKFWDIDGHTHSWLNGREVAKIIEFHEKQVMGNNKYDVELCEWHFLYGNGWAEFHKYRADYPEWVEDFRLIFWFDN